MQHVFLKINPFVISIFFMLFSFDTAWQKSGGASAPPVPPVSTPLLRDPLANEMQNGCPRLRRLDPICSKLDDFLNSSFLEKTSIFYILLKNAFEYADWSLRRGMSPAAQFQWDHEVLEFVETLEYHGQESMVNLLRGSGH